MQASDVHRAVAAAISTASALGLDVDDAIVLNDSNRLVVRLTPIDIIARVTPNTHQWHPEQEVELAKRLSSTQSPFAGLDPRVEPRLFEHDGFNIAMWTYFEPVDRLMSPTEYALELERLHAGLRQIDMTVPHITDRIGKAQRDVADHDITPDLGEPDRALLTDTLRDLRTSVVDRGAAEQLLHGEPHPWNVLVTKHGPLFIDFENCARGPVEYDLGWVPKDVSDCYPGVDQDLVDDCRGLVLAIIAMHRWRRGDEHPSGRESGVAFLNALRQGPPWPSPETVHW